MYICIAKRYTSLRQASTITIKSTILYNELLWHAVIDGQAIIEGSYIKGINEGRAEDEAKGRAEGEQNKAFETARKMKSKGYPIEEIAEMTELTVDDVKGL